MKMTPYDSSKLKTYGYKRSSNLELLEEFANSGIDCVKVEDWTQSTPNSCAGSLNSSIKRYNLYGIRAISRDGEVYLIKSSLFK